ncbi:MAG TPA: HAD family hydrolase [Chloroflexi bacterium]|nr:HAD family hydrolase [Chloroflexota bacterium]
MTVKRTLIIDADDTLWENNIYYEQSIEEFAELMAEKGFDRDEAVQMMHAVERERVPVVGYAPEEFARSMVIAYERLCQRDERPVEADVSARVLAIGRQVIGYPMVLLEGVEETLDWLRGYCRLMLLTKGDQAIQADKLDRSGLAHFFDQVHIVPEKDVAVFQDLIAEHDLDPAQTWMVGNSPRSDVNPALGAGLGAIYVPHPDTWVMELEEIAEPDGAIVLKSFADLVTWLSALTD